MHLADVFEKRIIGESEQWSSLNNKIQESIKKHQKMAVQLKAMNI